MLFYAIFRYFIISKMVCIYLIDIFIKNVKIMLFLTMEKVPESSKIKIHHVGDNMFYFENNNDPRLDS